MVELIRELCERRNKMATENIPNATAKRLPIYYRYLNILADSGKKRVSSTELAEAVKVDSATIRRDFSYFGALGKRGYGYEVEALIKFFKRFLTKISWLTLPWLESEILAMLY